MIRSIEDLKEIMNFFRKNWDLEKLEIFPRSKIELTNEEFNNLFEKEPDEVRIKDDITTEYFRYYEGIFDIDLAVYTEVYVDYRIENNKIRIIKIKMERWFEYED